MSLNLCEGGSVSRVSIPRIHYYLIHFVASLYVLCDIIGRLLGEEKEGKKEEKEEEGRGRRRKRIGEEERRRKMSVKKRNIHSH